MIHAPDRIVQLSGEARISGPWRRPIRKLLGDVKQASAAKVFDVIGSIERFATEREVAIDKLLRDIETLECNMGNNSETNVLALMFGNTAWANVGNSGGLQPSSAAGSFFVALSTGTLTGSSTQSTTEATYTGYARVGVSRAITGGWTASGTSPAQVANTAATTFGACTAGSSTVTYFSIGMLTSGAGDTLGYGALTASLAITDGITPSFAAAALVFTML